ncbi:MAG: hypothetical protein ABJA57_01950 [Ginsengibacter sp.]
MNKSPALSSPSSGYFFLNSDYCQVKIMFNDIKWMEGLRDYFKIHLKSSGKPLLFRSSLKALNLNILPLSLYEYINPTSLPLNTSLPYVKTSVFINEMELPVGETFPGAVEKLVRKELLGRV